MDTMFDSMDTMFDLEILPRLPVNTLQSCKCVTKEWNNWIKNPSFINFHLEKSIQNLNFNLVLFNPITNAIGNFDAKTLLPTTELYTFNLKKKLIMVGSCNGVLCYKFNESSEGSLYGLLLYNPTTRTTKTFYVPKLNHNLEGNPYYNDNEAFGFTCDNKNKDYKFVSIVRQEIHVYNLKSMSWKRIGEYSGKFCLQRIGGDVARGFPTDNALHWFYGDTSGIKGMFSIDFVCNKQFKTPFPRYDGRPSFVYLRGSLHLVLSKYIMHMNSWSIEIGLWVMNKYGNWHDSWVQLFKVQLDDMQYSTIPISFTEDGHKVLLECWRQREEKNKKSYVWYDLFTKELGNELHDVSSDLIAESCLETLVDPRSM
ncbi:hypothetical protein BVRB_014460 [Beta vulgaris subsp. vulgaris]|uniref:F-box associated beta-propeller type 1 domain-containing protein n=1 Tax=Beta vulgaris subsp. vulgaris TaxID=3555 RepID=A0A0J8B4V6_BETVV|nr:hypothetical protein BVRB_014460 [Beta vulgaris subsp. vulgaris]